MFLTLRNVPNSHIVKNQYYIWKMARCKEWFAASLVKENLIYDSVTTKNHNQLFDNGQIYNS